MAIETKVGAYQKSDKEVVIQYDGKRENVLELLAVLQAHVIMGVTNTPSEYNAVAERLQLITAERYRMLKLDEMRKRESDDDKPKDDGESFLGGIVH